jgi:hypothetical protein
LRKVITIILENQTENVQSTVPDLGMRVQAFFEQMCKNVFPDITVYFLGALEVSVGHKVSYRL